MDDSKQTYLDTPDLDKKFKKTFTGAAPSKSILRKSEGEKVQKLQGAPKVSKKEAPHKVKLVAPNSEDDVAKDKDEIAKIPPSPIGAIVDKYVAAGWSVMRMPSTNGLVDIVATKAASSSRHKERLHFIQYVHDDAATRYTGEARNVFVQNAFSNGAVPVHARVVFSKKSESAPKVTLQDVNAESFITLR